MADLTDALADGPLASDGTTLSAATSLSEAWSVSEAYAAQIIPGGLAGGNFSITESFVLSLTRNAVMAEAVRLGALFQVLRQASISDTMSLTGSFTAWANALLKSGLKMADVFTTSFTYNLTVSQALRIVEALDIHNGLSVSDTFFMRNATPAYAFVGNSQIVEAISLAVNLQQHLVLRLAFADEIDLTDAELLNFIYHETITESFAAEILYAAPDKTISTWAVNTRTNAVTEYGNFSFNSFANMGRKYLAADQNGLYELNGARDLTQDVIATFGGGYFQPNGAKFAGLKGVYLGMTGQGNYLLKVITGDGGERVYRAMLNPGLMTTKVNIGKGIRARYISWELTNEDGQDFDFDQIEFIPMMSGRRV